MLSLLQRRLPVELCWEVFSYLMHAADTRETFRMDRQQLHANWKLRCVQRRRQREQRRDSLADSGARGGNHSSSQAAAGAAAVRTSLYPDGGRPSRSRDSGRFEVVLTVGSDEDWSVTAHYFDAALDFMVERLWRFRDARTAMTMGGDAGAGAAMDGQETGTMDADEYFDRFHPGLLQKLAEGHKSEPAATAQTRSQNNSRSTSQHSSIAQQLQLQPQQLPPVLELDESDRDDVLGGLQESRSSVLVEEPPLKEAHVQQLCALGFTVERSRRCLQLCGGDPAAAANMLMDGWAESDEIS